MNEISEKNVALVSEFVKYQEGLIEKLKGKHSTWDGIEHQLNLLEARFNEQMARNDLPTKLATIGALEYEIEALVEELQELEAEKKEKRKW